ncbi:hypothetical protein [Sulfolobus acidocaldarius]|nr:hypothetical protein [Sulfolobus acidocaldarius]AAY80491.1 hypothetical membrane protein [Sulfolobus acidocaldarius DSM 639]
MRARVLKMFYYSLKERYNISVFIFLILVNLIALISRVITDNPYNSFKVFPVDYGQITVIMISFLVLTFSIIRGLFQMEIKSNIDFLLTTQERPQYLLLMAGIADSIYMVILLISFVITYSKFLNAINILDLVMFTTSLSILIVSLKSITTLKRLVIVLVISAYIIVSALLFPPLNPIIWIIQGSVLGSIVLALSLAISTLFCIHASNEIYQNAYGGDRYELSNDEVKVNKELPKNIVKLMFYTSVHSIIGARAGFRNVLYVIIPPSLLLGLLAWFFGHNFVWLLILSILGYINYSVYVGFSIESERLWINFVNLDFVSYIRYRMLIRVIMSFISLSPFLVSLALLHDMSLFFVTLSYPFLICPLSWLLFTYSGVPQTKDIGVDYANQEAFLTISRMMIMLILPVLGTAEAIIGSLSLYLGSEILSFTNIIAYVILVYVKSGIWGKVVEKLTVNGYV